MADVIEKDLTKVTSSDLTPITKPSGTDKRYMRMVDKDGNSVDVEVPAFLRAAIRDELASILESGGTGGGSVLSVIGGILKTRTDADLASVLGVVPYKALPRGVNLNTVRSTIVYYSINDEITASVVNAPETYTGGNILFVCFSLYANFCVQFLVHYATPTVNTENTLYMRNIAATFTGSWKAVGAGL